MATVYLAQDLKHDRAVAVKVLRRDVAEAVGAERFLAEIKTTAHLKHPHILPLFDSGWSTACCSTSCRSSTGNRCTSGCSATVLCRSISRGHTPRDRRRARPTRTRLAYDASRREAGQRPDIRGGTFSWRTSASRGSWGGPPRPATDGHRNGAHRGHTGVPWRRSRSAGRDRVDERTDIYAFGVPRLLEIAHRRPAVPTRFGPKVSLTAHLTTPPARGDGPIVRDVPPAPRRPW